jgi:hypothetical protein
MAPQEPTVNLKEIISSNDDSDDAIDSSKSGEKRLSSHSSSDSDDSESIDDGLSIHSYNGAEKLEEDRKSISRVDDRTLSKYATGRSTRTGMSVATTTDPDFEIDFADGDPSDPHNWPFWYRCCVIFFVSYSTLTV